MKRTSHARDGAYFCRLFAATGTGTGTTTSPLYEGLYENAFKEAVPADFTP